MTRTGWLLGLLASSLAVLAISARVSAEGELSLDAAARPLATDEARQVEVSLQAAVRPSSGARVELELRHRPLTSAVAAPAREGAAAGDRPLSFDPETIKRSSRSVAKKQAGSSSAEKQQLLVDGLLDEVDRLAAGKTRAATPPASAGGVVGVKPDGDGSGRLRAEPRPGMLGTPGTGGARWQGGGARSGAGPGGGQAGPGGGAGVKAGPKAGAGAAAGTSVGPGGPKGSTAGRGRKR